MPEVTLEVGEFSEDLIHSMPSKPIDYGGQGIVYPAHLEAHGDVAVKIFSSSQSIRGSDKKEIINLLKHTANRYLVRFLGVVVNTDGDIIGHVTEFMDGGSLSKVIHNESGKYLYRQAYDWIEQAARGLQFLHEKHIVHRDVKPANMLLSDNQKNLKICDLGLSRHFSAITSYGGTTTYVSPETIHSAGTASFPADVWSFGVTIWELLTRRYPYLGEGDCYEIERKVRDGKLTLIWTAKGDKGKEVGELLSRIFQYNPQERPTTREIREFATKMKERHPEKGRWEYLKKESSEDSLAPIQTLSLSDPSTGCSSSSSEAPRSKKKTVKKYYDDWLETSRSITIAGSGDRELSLICSLVDQASIEMSNLNRKRSPGVLEQCLNQVGNWLKQIVEHINGAKAKDKAIKAQLTLLERQTEIVKKQFEDEVTKRRDDLSLRQTAKLLLNLSQKK